MIRLGWLAEAGADVVVNYRSREVEAASVCREVERCGVKSLAVRADVSPALEVVRLLGEVEAVLGAPSILVNNAGIGRPKTLGTITESDWDEVIAVNLKSVFLVTQAVLPNMRAAKWGRIVNVTSRS